jgi:hypothetical protein
MCDWCGDPLCRASNGPGPWVVGAFRRGRLVAQASFADPEALRAWEVSQREAGGDGPLTTIRAAGTVLPPEAVAQGCFQSVEGAPCGRA